MLLFFLSFFATAYSYNNFKNTATNKLTSDLFAGKHLASSGTFLDMFPRSAKLAKKAAKITEKLEFNTETVGDGDLQTGASKRSTRNRNLKELKKELDLKTANNGPVITRIEPKKKRSDEDIMNILSCLNGILTLKETLTEPERLGLYDQAIFDSLASQTIDLYLKSPNVAKNTHAWISFHRKKGSLKCDGGKWTWEKK